MSRFHTVLAAALALALGASGCTSRCARVASARAALLAREPAGQRAADGVVTLPFARANALFAELLAQKPLRIALEAAELGLLRVAVPAGLAVQVREVRLEPAPAERVRLAIHLTLSDAEEELTTLTGVVELEPELVRHSADTSLVLALSPEKLLELSPDLGARPRAALARALSRWLPAPLRGKIPASALDAAVAELGQALAATTYRAVRRNLLSQLGELTRLTLRLPDLPLERTALRSLQHPVPALELELYSSLPIRPLASPASPRPNGEDITVELTASTAAELANWAIARGLAPRWYTRDLAPSPRGEFRPLFDYRAEDRAHPWKIASLQERGGCSYFLVGARAELAVRSEKLEVTVTDRQLEAAETSWLMRAAAWLKFLLTGAIDRSRRVAAHTELTIGGRTLRSEVVSAELAHDRLRFGLELRAVTTPTRAANR